MPILGVIDSAKSGHLWAPVGAYEPIGIATVPSGGAVSVGFGSIPQTYAHLQIRAIAKDSQSTGNHSFSLVFNSDTGANYSYHSVGGTGSTTTASSSTSLSASYAGFITAIDSTSIFAANIIDILDYSNSSKNTTTRTLGGADLNGSGQVQLISTAWFNTSAVTSIVIYPASGQTFQQYSSFALYGIKG
jgi:hypothetical protein